MLGFETIGRLRVNYLDLLCLEVEWIGLTFLESEVVFASARLASSGACRALRLQSAKLMRDSLKFLSFSTNPSPPTPDTAGHAQIWFGEPLTHFESVDVHFLLLNAFFAVLQPVAKF